MKPRRALITGVTGQDGWYLSELLLAGDYEVFGLVRPGDSTAVPSGVEVISGDLADQASLAAAVRASVPDEVYNLAGISSVAQSWKEPTLTADITGLGFLRLLIAVRDFDAEAGTSTRVVQASSGEIFGHAPAPQTEQTPMRPSSPYGAAKTFAQNSATVFRAVGASVSSAIFYNHESPRRPATFVTRRITSTVARISQGSGEMLRLGNLTSRRDWGYAGDYVRALHLIARHPDPDDFVIATGSSHSVGDFVEAAFAHVGMADWESLVDVDPDYVRPADPGEQRGDASKARDLLGWAPEMSFIELVGLMVDADLQAQNR